MTFLTPIPALIAAALTVPALFTLYFLKLRRRPIRVSSTLLWDQAVRDLQVNIPFRLVRPTWILLLQLLILASLLLAFARPALDLRGGVPSRVILLIDRSASMSAMDAPGPSPRSRLEAAKARALERIDALAASGSSFIVIPFAAESTPVGAASTPAAAKAAVASITPTDQPGDLASALRLASSLLTGDGSEGAPRPRGLVVLFSDGGCVSTEPFSLAGADFRFERIGPDAPEEQEPRPEALLPDNLGIVALAARREWDNPGSVRVFARVQNASSRPVTTPVSLVLDDKEISSRLMTVPPAVNGTPASVPVSFDLESREGGTLVVQLSRPDVLGADDRVWMVLAPATKPRVLVVIPEPGTGPRTEWLITSIIEELRLPMRIMSAGLYAQEPAGANFDLVIFDRVAPSTVPACASLSFGAGLPGHAVGPESARPGYTVSWNRSHPTLRHASLETMYVARPLGMSGFGPDDELARGPGSAWIASVPGPGPRRMVVAFDLAQSNWPKLPGFAIFLASAIDYLTMRAEDRAGQAFTTGEPVEVKGAPGTLRVNGPSPRSVPGPARPGDTINLGVFDKVGIYQVTNVAEGAPGSFAVNMLDEAESAAPVRDSIEVSGQAVTSASGDAGPREVWPWFIVLALVLLSIEWLFNAWMMKA